MPLYITITVHNIIPTLFVRFAPDTVCACVGSGLCKRKSGVASLSSVNASLYPLRNFFPMQHHTEIPMSILVRCHRVERRCKSTVGPAPLAASLPSYSATHRTTFQLHKPVYPTNPAPGPSPRQLHHAAPPYLYTFFHGTAATGVRCPKLFSRP